MNATPDQVRAYVVSAVADGRQELGSILSEVGTWASEDQVVVPMPALLDAISSLIRDRIVLTQIAGFGMHEIEFTDAIPANVGAEDRVYFRLTTVGERMLADVAKEAESAG